MNLYKQIFKFKQLSRNRIKPFNLRFVFLGIGLLVAFAIVALIATITLGVAVFSYASNNIDKTSVAETFSKIQTNISTNGLAILTKCADSAMPLLNWNAYISGERTIAETFQNIQSSCVESLMEIENKKT